MERGCVYGSAIVRTESPCLMWMKNKRHADTPAKLILNTFLLKYFMILTLFKNVVSIDMVCHMKSLYGGCKMKTDMVGGRIDLTFSRHVGDMNLSASTSSV